MSEEKIINFRLLTLHYGYLVKIPELETAHAHHSNIMY